MPHHATASNTIIIFFTKLYQESSILFYEHYKLYWYTHNILTMHTVIYENGNQVLANYSCFQWRIHCYCPMPGEEKEGNLV